MTFQSYYRGEFRTDLAAVLSALPGLHWNPGGGEQFVQPITLSMANPTIRSWSHRHRDQFAIALFWTVLVDQVCFTYFRPQYAAFQAMTMYPKFTGDCPGGCGGHIHPRHILLAVGSPPYVGGGDWTGTADPSEDSLAVMHEEVFDFFKHHLPEVAPDEFWTRCLAELPVLQAADLS